MLRGNILWCVNYISLKLLLQNFKQNIHRREEIDQSIIVRNVNPLLIIKDRNVYKTSVRIYRRTEQLYQPI